MKSLTKNILVLTHDGSFHADEVFACATLSLWAEKNNLNLKIKRSRDFRWINKAQIVVDVGMEYDPNKGKFDHHQIGGAGARPNGIPYASFGLVWKHYGLEICENSEFFALIENNLVLPIDAVDNGINIYSGSKFGISEHTTSHSISIFNPTWQEDVGKTNYFFKKALSFAKYIINREMSLARAKIEGSKLTEKLIKEQNEPEILIIDGNFDWEEAVSGFRRIKIVIYKNKNKKDWSLQVARDNIKDFNSDRVSFPKSWWGLRGGDLEKISGVKGVVFCSNGGWFAVTKTKESALKIANLALQNYSN